MTSITFISTFFASSFSIPLSLKIGAVKSRFLLVIVFTVLGTLMGNISGFVRNNNYDMFSKLSDSAVIHIIICIVSFALFLLSFYASLAVVRKKEY